MRRMHAPIPVLGVVAMVLLLSSCMVVKVESGDGTVPKVTAGGVGVKYATETQAKESEVQYIASDDPRWREWGLAAEESDVNLVANDGYNKKYEGEEGECSFYKKPQKTASGERFDPNAMTAAHKSLPLGSIVRCTRTDTNATVVVRINDRGPYVNDRVIDLSRGAAAKIDLHEDGVAPCKIDVLAYPDEAEKKEEGEKAIEQEEQEERDKPDRGEEDGRESSRS